jgi:DnaJ-class molecular chaperone
MADDPYQILGLSRDADQDAIRKAYRQLAKESHPDLHPGDATAEATFKRVGAANAILSDPERRARFDRGEIDGDGQERPPPGYGAHAQGPHGRRYGPGTGPGTGAGPGAGPGAGWNQDDLGDIFGEDRSYTLSVSFVDSALGATTRITLPGGSVLDVKVPPGIEDGQTLRLRGKGGDGIAGGPSGDALIRIQVTPDARFTRDGLDLRTNVVVGLREAVLGGQIQVPTPAGPVTLTVPPDSDTGRVLRLRGRGIAAHGGREAGNLYATLTVHLGQVDDALRAFLRGEPVSGAVAGDAA